MTSEERDQRTKAVTSHPAVDPWLRSFICGSTREALYEWNTWFNRSRPYQRSRIVAVLHDYYLAALLANSTEDREEIKAIKRYIHQCAETNPGLRKDRTNSKLFHDPISGPLIRSGEMRVLNILPGERTRKWGTATKSLWEKELAGGAGAREIYNVAADLWMIPALKDLNPSEEIWLCGEWSWYVRKKVRLLFPHLKVLCRQHPSTPGNAWKEARVLKDY